MTIPESQLATWSKQGATVTAQSTHQTIRNVLDNSSYLSGRTVDFYLQGSYRNFTNIRGDSDVDLVAELQSVYYGNIDQLTEPEKQAYELARNPADYHWRDFRRDVIATLKERYGNDVDDTAKRCVKIKANSGRLPADVVVCLEYRLYTRFNSHNDCDYVSGIKFLDLENNNWIVNFPKVHYSNGSNKNAYERTKQNYKPTIRMFKNARKRLIDRGMMLEDTAPSYFVECLLYNVPDDYFIGTFQERYSKILAWLYFQFSNNKAQNFVCQNEQIQLFGSSSVQWNVDNAWTLIRKLADLWENF